MTAHCNLRRDGAAKTAFHVRRVMRTHACEWKVLLVRPCGRVRVMRRDELTPDRAPHLVGTYNDETPPAQIAEDCEEWLRLHPKAE